jgi:hypothetical protein
MDKERVKLIVKNMELLVDALKKELNEVDSFVEEEEVMGLPFEGDYDEVFSE